MDVNLGIAKEIKSLYMKLFKELITYLELKNKLLRKELEEI